MNIPKSNDQEEDVYIAEYNPQWIQKFETEKKLIEHTLGPWINGGIQHVGSTAVPGLDAKPIVDIMIGVENLEKAKECIAMLESIGYQYYPYRSEIMHWFCKPSSAHRDFHAYLMETTNPEWEAIIIFRDYLRSHSETAMEYSLLKKDLATQFKTDRESYTKAKTSFVKRILSKALEINNG